MSISLSENLTSPMEAETCGVIELTTMISRESGRWGVGVGLTVDVSVWLGLGAGVDVRLGVLDAGVALPAGAGDSGVETKGFHARNVSAVMTIKSNEMPVIHQPASTR